MYCLPCLRDRTFKDQTHERNLRPKTQRHSPPIYILAVDQRNILYVEELHRVMGKGVSRQG